MELSSQLQVRKGPGVVQLGRSVALRLVGKGKGKGKGNVHPTTGHEGPQGE